MNLKVDQVLVTGGAGFIGSWLVQRLLKVGNQVIVLDDLSTGSISRLPNHPNLEVVIGSVLDLICVRKVVKRARLVIHLAGVVGMRLANHQRELAYRIATEGTSIIMEETGTVPIFLFSSSAVYGYAKSGTSAREKLSVLRNEEIEYDGGQPGYATGKFDMEQMALTIASQQQRQVLCVRPFNVVGPGQQDTYGMVLPSFAMGAKVGWIL